MSQSPKVTRGPTGAGQGGALFFLLTQYTKFHYHMQNKAIRLALKCIFLYCQ